MLQARLDSRGPGPRRDRISAAPGPNGGFPASRGRLGTVCVLGGCDLLGGLAGFASMYPFLGWLLTGVLVLAVLASLPLGPGGYHWRAVPSFLDDALGICVRIGLMALLAVGVFVLAHDSVGARQVMIGSLLLLGAMLVFRAVGLIVLGQVRKRGMALMNALIIGCQGEGARVTDALLGTPEYGVRIAGFVEDVPRPEHGERMPIRVLGDLEHTPELVHRFGIELVLVTFTMRSASELVPVLRELTSARCEVYYVPRLFEMVHRPAYAQLVAGVVLARLRRATFRSIGWRCKRVLDPLLAGLGLVVLSPVLGVLALAVRIEGGPGVLFKQWRIGLNGQPFLLYKFRSLKPAGEEDERRWNIEGDARIGPVGRFIRKTSLDELPQLVNVVRGEMSLVGPRPERPQYVEQFSQSVPGYRQRHRVPVGCTGYAVTQGLKGDTSIADRARFDNLYADSWSLWLDVKIVLQTVRQLLWPR